MLHCLGISQSLATAGNIVQAMCIKWAMLQLQQVLSRYKIEFWCELLTTAIFIWENVDLCFGQKYIFTYRLGGGRKDLDVRSTFRIIEFSVYELPPIENTFKRSSKCKTNSTAYLFL